MQREILAKALERNEMVSIYTNRSDTERFAAGFIIKMDENSVIIAHVSKTGSYDGYLIKDIDNMYQITIGGKYEMKLQKLYSLQNQCHEYDGFKDKKNLYHSLISFAKQKNFVVTLQLINSGLDDVTGFIDCIEEENISVHVIDYHGNGDGFSQISLDDISAISCDSADDSPLKLLYESQL